MKKLQGQTRRKDDGVCGEYYYTFEAHGSLHAIRDVDQQTQFGHLPGPSKTIFE